MRAVRVTVVVPCVCMSVRSFLPPRASRHRNIDVRVHRGTENTFIIAIFTKNARFRSYEPTASFACFGCHQLYLKEMLHWPDI